jgi:hypothetical protein
MSNSILSALSSESISEAFGKQGGLEAENPTPVSPTTILPPKAAPVSLRRKSYADHGVQEENYPWLPFLADGVGKRCIGRDPMDIPVEVLTASGHPPRRTSALVTAFAKGAGGDCLGLEVAHSGPIGRGTIRTIRDAARPRLRRYSPEASPRLFD